MNTCELTKEELVRRKNLVAHARQVIVSQMPIAEEDENHLMTTYRDFVLQITFCDLHPLMVFDLAKQLDGNISKLKSKTNEMNLTGVYGSHTINESIRCYSYRATHWLDTEIEAARFLEILDRCVVEATQGYQKVAC